MSEYKKEIADSIYDAFVVVGFTIGYAMIGKKVFGMSKPNAKMDFEDVAKLTGYVSAAMMSKDYAVKQGWIPASIINK